MRNLRTVSARTTRLELGEHSGLTVFAFDSIRRHMVFATTTGSLLCFSSTEDPKPLWTVQLDLSFVDDHKDQDRIAGLAFMVDNEVLVVGTTFGELFSVSISTHFVEAIGKLEGSIRQMSSSPDGEVLALVAGSGVLVVMTQDWEVLYELPLDEHEKTQGSFVHPTEEPKDPVQISWRLDGKYFATLGGETFASGTKELRVWERETGALHSRSKPFPFMGTALDWIPNGARIATACSQSLAGMSGCIQFFERNGLERGFLDIDGPSSAIIERVQWNCNSELLAVLLRCKGWDAIQVWSFSNYHWYLKQEWRYWEGHHIDFIWDPEKPLELITWILSGSVQIIQLCWDCAVTCESIALVIDGSRLLVTPLNLAQIPPPMSLFQLRFQSPIQTVALRLEENSSCLAASLSDGTLGIVKFCSVENWSILEDTETVVMPSASIGDAGRPMRLLSWIDLKTIIGVPCMQNIYGISSEALESDHTDSELVMEIETCDESSNIDNIFLLRRLLDWKQITPIGKRVLAFLNNPLGNGLLVHLEDGTTHSYLPKKGLFMAGEIQVTSTPCFWFQALFVPPLEKVVIISLDEYGKLFVGSDIICADCTSFCIHNAYIKGKKIVHILYTTKNDLLHIINLQELLGLKEATCVAYEKRMKGQAGQVKVDAKKDCLKMQTLWEKGLRLVAVLGGRGVAVLLQTTRGNLETLYPRILILCSMAAALWEGNFYDALVLARQHHLNLNLIVDFKGWKAFLLVAAEFVRQVKNLNYIIDLISSVSAEKVGDTAYSNVLLPFMRKIAELDCEPVPVSELELNHDQGSKIRLVLEAIRKAVDDVVVESPKKELCILTAMARSDPPELEAALCRIKKLREQEMGFLMEEADNHQASGHLSAEDALKHLLWLSDYKSVFNAALGLYDLHLAAMVASNSQGDPKEFLPLLQELEEMSTPVMKYTIDYRLGKYESALRNLALAGDEFFDKCLDLIRNNPTLFPLGKNLFKKAPQKMVLLEAWGDFLLARKRYENAAAAYCSCSLLTKAMGAYRGGGCWQSVLIMAKMLGFTQAEVRKIALELREELQALGRPGDAAKIALEYCDDVYDAVQLFIEARDWNEAVRVAYAYEKGELIQDQVLPAALECASSYMIEIEEQTEKVGKYLARFLAVQQRRLLLDMKLKMNALGDIEDDAASDVSSHVSSMSAYTSGARSSSRAGTTISKQGRQKSRSGKIRAGSPGEEDALAQHIKEMELTSGKTEELKKLLHVLVLLGRESIAEKLQRTAFHFQSAQLNAVIQTCGQADVVEADKSWSFDVLCS